MNLRLLYLLAVFFASFSQNAFANDYPACNAVPGDVEFQNASSCQGSILVEISCPSPSTDCKPTQATCNLGFANNYFDHYCASATGRGRALDEPVDLQVAGPTNQTQTPAAAAAAKAKAEAEALALEIEEANRKLAEELALKAKNSQGHQATLLKEGNDSNELGRNHAASVGALWCAEGANAQPVNQEVASESYQKCQQNFAVAKSFPSSEAGYRGDSGLLGGPAARQTLGNFEKNFGLSEDEYTSRILGAGGGPASLSDMVKDKISEEELAAAMAAGGGDEKFAVSGAGGKVKTEKKDTLRDSIKKALAKKDAGGKDRAPSSVGEKEKPAANLLTGLTAETNVFSSPEEKDTEVTIFGVVHLKYEDILKRRRL
jgi:hypothetical protein